MPTGAEDSFQLRNFMKFWKENEVLNDLRNEDALDGEYRYGYICGGCRA